MLQILPVALNIGILLISCTVLAADDQGGMPQLNPESYTSQIFWLIIFFSLLLSLVHFVFLPKIVSIRSKREKFIDECISESKRINAEIESIINKIEADYQSAKEEFDSKIKKAYDENKQDFEEKNKIINEGFENKKIKLSKEISDSRNAIKSKLKKYSISLSDQIYQKIMNEKIKGNLDEFNEVIGDKN